MQGKPNMETIMSQIKEHLLPTVDHGANGNIHHYNRVWEKIEKWASMPPNTQMQIDGLKCASCGKKYNPEDWPNAWRCNNCI